MATLQQLEAALIKADSAGNAEDAKMLADEIRRQRDAGPPVAPPGPQVVEPIQPPPDEIPRTMGGLMSIPGRVADKLQQEVAPLKDRGFQNLSPMERAKLMAYSAPAYLGQEVLGVGAKAGPMIKGTAQRVIPTAVGQKLGQATRIPFMDRVGAGLGAMGGELWAENSEGGGIHPGRIWGSGVAALATGKPMVGATGREIAKEAAIQGTANLAGGVTEKYVDEKRLPTAKEAAIYFGSGAASAPAGAALENGAAFREAQEKAMRQATKLETIKQARLAGYTIPPVMLDDSFVNKTINSIAGKASTLQEAGARNQEITNALASKAIGAPVNAPITEELLRQIRDEAAEPYKRIEQISKNAEMGLGPIQKSDSSGHGLAIAMDTPQARKLTTEAAADIKSLGEARKTAAAYYQHHFVSKDPKSLEIAQAAEAAAEKLEEKIATAVGSFGSPELVAQHAAARERIAKTYEVEKALNLGNSDVNAETIGKSFDKQGKNYFKGELGTIGATQQTFKPVMRPGASIPTSGVNQLKAIASGLGAVTGTAQGGPWLGAVGAVLPFMDYPMRKAYLSNFYINSAAKNMYPGLKNEEFQAVIGRYLTSEKGRESVRK